MFGPKPVPPDKLAELLRRFDALMAFPEPYRHFTDLHSFALQLLDAHGKSEKWFGPRSLLEHHAPGARIRIHFKQVAPDTDSLTVEAEREKKTLKAVLWRQQGVQTQKFTRHYDVFHRFHKGHNEEDVLMSLDEMEPKKVDIYAGRVALTHHYE